jgi:hypothetical protein
MKKTALTIFGALLISGLAVQMAAASQHHHRGKAHLSNFRGAYNQVNGPISVRPIQPAFQPAPALPQTESGGMGGWGSMTGFNGASSASRSTHTRATESEATHARS